MNLMISQLRSVAQEAKALLFLAMPIIITQLATNGMNFADTSMAGQSSATDLAAIAVGTSLWIPASLLLRGILMMLTPVTAHHRGANNFSEISSDLRQTLWIAMLCAAVLIGYLNLSETILVFMNVAPEVIPVAVGYLDALAFGLPGIAIFYTLNSFLEGMGNTRVSMVVSIVGLLVNIPINYVLIYGEAGFPTMGAVGSGWATSLVYWLMSLMMFVYIIKHNIYSSLLKCQEKLPKMARMAELFRLGFPIGINIFVCGSIFAVISLFIGKLGASNIAAAQIALNFSSMTYMIPMSLSFGITIRVGHALGQGRESEARLRAMSGIVLSALIATLSVACLLLFPQQIIALYTTDPVIVKGASALLAYTAFYQISDAIQTSVNGALRGYKDTRIPMMLACFAYWGIALPLGYGFGMTDMFGTAMGTVGFWVGIVTGLTLAACFMAARLVRVIGQNDQQMVAIPA